MDASDIGVPKVFSATFELKTKALPALGLFSKTATSLP